MKQIVSGLLLSLGCSISFAGTMGNIGTPNNFNGFYAGLGTGMLNLLTKDSFASSTNTGAAPVTGNLSFTDSSVLFDGHLGYGKLFNQHTYLGAKTFAYYTPLQHIYTRSFTTTTGSVLTNGNHVDTFAVKPIYNIDAILGFEVLPHVLPYLEAGVSFSNVKANYKSFRTQSNLASNNQIAYSNDMTSNTYKTGYNVGIGANYLVQKNWFLSSELIYNYLGTGAANQSVNVPQSNTVQAFSNKATNQAVSLLASISYLFPSA